MGDEVDSNGGFRVSTRELYDMMSRVAASMTSLELQTATRLQALETRVDNVLGENVDLRKRVRGLELKYYGVAAGLVTALITIGARVGGIF